MKKILFSLLFAVGLNAQNPTNLQPMFNYVGTVIPGVCNNGDLFYNVITYQTYRCGPINSWVIFSNGGSVPVVAGAEKVWQLAVSISGTPASAVDLPSASPTVPTLLTSTNGSIQAVQNFTLGSTTCLQIGPWNLPSVLPSSIDLRMTATSPDVTHASTVQASVAGGNLIDPNFNGANTVSFTATTAYSDAVITGLNLSGLSANSPMLVKVCVVGTSLTSDLSATTIKLVLH